MTAGERWSDRYAGAGGDAAGGYHMRGTACNRRLSR